MGAMANGFIGPWVDNRTLLISGLISLVLHTLGLALLIWMPDLHWNPDNLGPVYTVDLVGAPGLPAPPPPQGDPDAGPAETVPENAVIPEEAPPAPAEPAELIPIGKEEEKIEEVKKPEEIESVVKMGTPKKSSKTVKVQPEKDIDEALDKLKKKTKDKKKKKARRKRPGYRRSNIWTKPWPGSGSGSKAGPTAWAPGEAEEEAARTAAWPGTTPRSGRKSGPTGPFPPNGRMRRWRRFVIISLLPNGAITSIKFEKRSGYPTFDQSVLWAVERSNPLPAMPTGVSSGIMEIGIRFKPED